MKNKKITKELVRREFHVARYVLGLGIGTALVFAFLILLSIYVINNNFIESGIIAMVSVSLFLFIASFLINIEARQLKKKYLLLMMEKRVWNVITKNLESTSKLT